MTRRRLACAVDDATATAQASAVTTRPLAGDSMVRRTTERIELLVEWHRLIWPATYTGRACGRHVGEWRIREAAPDEQPVRASRMGGRRCRRVAARVTFPAPSLDSQAAGRTARYGPADRGSVGPVGADPNPP
jgi:hypothetical protein